MAPSTLIVAICSGPMGSLPSPFVVKNTFIDVEDAPTASPLIKYKTCPASFGPHICFDEQDALATASTDDEESRDDDEVMEAQFFEEEEQGQHTAPPRDDSSSMGSTQGALSRTFLLSFRTQCCESGTCMHLLGAEFWTWPERQRPTRPPAFNRASRDVRTRQIQKNMEEFCSLDFEEVDAPQQMGLTRRLLVLAKALADDVAFWEGEVQQKVKAFKLLGLNETDMLIIGGITDAASQLIESRHYSQASSKLCSLRPLFQARGEDLEVQRQRLRAVPEVEPEELGQAEAEAEEENDPSELCTRRHRAWQQDRRNRHPVKAPEGPTRPPTFKKASHDDRTRQIQKNMEEFCSLDFEEVDATQQMGLTRRLLVLAKALADGVTYWEGEVQQKVEAFKLLGLSESDMLIIGGITDAASQLIESRHYSQASSKLCSLRPLFQAQGEDLEVQRQRLLAVPEVEPEELGQAEAEAEEDNDPSEQQVVELHKVSDEHVVSRAMEDKSAEESSWMEVARPARVAKVARPTRAAFSQRQWADEASTTTRDGATTSSAPSANTAPAWRTPQLKGSGKGNEKGTGKGKGWKGKEGEVEKGEDVKRLTVCHGKGKQKVEETWQPVSDRNVVAARGDLQDKGKGNGTAAVTTQEEPESLRRPWRSRRQTGTAPEQTPAVHREADCGNASRAGPRSERKTAVW